MIGPIPNPLYSCYSSFLAAARSIIPMSYLLYEFGGTINSITLCEISRSSCSITLQQAASMSLDQVSAAVSVLLGFAPPPSLPAQSSSKVLQPSIPFLYMSPATLLNPFINFSYPCQLDKLLLPNPFDRPRAVFLLQIDGFHGMSVLFHFIICTYSFSASIDVSLHHMSASVESITSEAGSIFKTTIDGLSDSATGLTGFTKYLATSYLGSAHIYTFLEHAILLL